MDGDDGIGYETLFAKSPSANLTSLNASFKPDSNVGYDDGDTKTGTIDSNSVSIVWVDGKAEVALDPDNPYLLEIARPVAGVPEDSESPYIMGTTYKHGWGNWGDIKITGYYGVSYREKTIYRVKEIEDALPSTPTGGAYASATDTLTPPSGWSNSFPVGV